MKFSALPGIVAFLLISLAAYPVSADCVVCNNQAVCNGATKAETVDKCGQPRGISADESTTTGTTKRYGNEIRFQSETRTNETWTYVIDGSYRHLFFVGDTLDRIRFGSSAPASSTKSSPSPSR